MPDDELLAAGLAFAAEVAAKSPLAVANAKQVMHHAVGRQRHASTTGSPSSSSATSSTASTSHDAPEGLAAFAEKRAPRFEGR